MKLIEGIAYDIKTKTGSYFANRLYRGAYWCEPVNVLELLFEDAAGQVWVLRADKIEQITEVIIAAVHGDWFEEVYRVMRKNYGNAKTFSSDNNLSHPIVLKFLKGKAIQQSTFKAICNVLDFDWEKVQKPY